MTVRRLVVIGGVVAAALLGWAGPSWACIPQPIVQVTPMNAGAAGDTVTVNGFRFAEGPVEIRWNAIDGPLLGKATGPNFSATVKVPDAPTGLYSLVVFSRAADGSVGALASVSSFNISTVVGLKSRPSTVEPHPAKGGTSLLLVAVVAVGSAGVGGAAVAGAGWRRRGELHVDAENKAPGSGVTEVAGA